MTSLASAETDSQAPVAIAVHGGAGVIQPGSLTEEREAAIREALERAVRAGHTILTDGGTSRDAVIAAIEILEDAPEFNAGRGSVLTSQGRVEMDASLMTGHDLQAGAVAGVTGIRHPIHAARGVLEHSPHVMLAGEGAEDFARELDLEFRDPDWFITEFRSEQLRRIQSDEQVGITHAESWFSTVGAVALDAAGNLAAGTSTGGTANKRWGRIGDSPVIGAGTYADNRTCAVSATGQGEYFIRHVVAYDICARMAYTSRPLEQTANQVIHQVLANAGGDGGVIAVDRRGRITMPFNTEGMYRAAIHRDGRLELALYGDGADSAGNGH